MFDTIKKLLGLEKTDYAQLVADGAIILDVRTKGEYNAGHIRGSVNIPLDKLSDNLGKFKQREKTIITCCASGARSASAKNFLKAKGYSNVYNGGAWPSLNRKIQS
jgi:rhodanese-related sulfurtransferase